MTSKKGADGCCLTKGKRVTGNAVKLMWSTLSYRTKAIVCCDGEHWRLDVMKTFVLVVTAICVVVNIPGALEGNVSSIMAGAFCALMFVINLTMED
ncbi:MAG: hypothetical protein KAS32_28960 [Candidatus Peribacteraceae bacterium]|nr:hypothetical protein [Candidatus Peribacteraceae bacterium]